MKTIQCLIVILIAHSVHAQQPYWQQEVNFKINVSLNDKDHTLEAFESIEYINHSPDTLRYIWFHLWPNAYKNDRTAFSEQLIKQGNTDFYFSKPKDKGYINQLNFKVDGNAVVTLPDTNNIDIVAVVLPLPLLPGKKIGITTPFKVKLPFNFSRGGHVGNDYQITQWFPKPAVYDHQGWHPMPYLDQGEFYSEFGKFEVAITVPSAYVVAATGILQDTSTLREMKTMGKHSVTGVSKTWHFIQDNIHDFAWFASKNYVVKYDTVILSTSKVVDVFSYYKKGNKAWAKSIGYAKEGLRKYSEWIGDYPYSIASVVQGNDTKRYGGMEYPTITLITTSNDEHELDATLVHELGHNWFYGALASNERTHPWMDEGMNTFYQKKYEWEKYHSYMHLVEAPFKNTAKFPDDEEAMLLATMAKIEKDQPIDLPADQYSEINYNLVVYYKASRWMKKLQDEMGRETFDKAMQEYYRNWKFKHPYPEDYKAAMEKNVGKKLDAIFNLLNETGPIAKAEKKSIKPTFLYNLKNTDQYHYVSISPAIGYNFYDKVMFGAMVHNYQLPLNKFQFIAGGLYSGKAKELHPFGHISYNLYHRKYNFSMGIGYASFTKDDFLTDNPTTLFMGVKRIVPSATLTFFDKDANSSRQFTIQWKSIFLNEGNLNFKTVYTPTDTFDVVSVEKENTLINRLSLSMSDDRKLFPFSINLTADQGKDFIRTGLTGKYFFNYADGKSGMSARFFAGKFFYLTSKTNLTQYKNEKYFLNLSAPKGYEDYTYSDYFVGRNQFEGWMSQQVMERDGYFKVNTELLGNKIGKTDDWLMAVNLSTDIPAKFNPLSILNIPLKAFADVGTYAEAWGDNPPSGKFVYDAGLQVSLFSSVLNIYVPLLYSKVYSDYYKSTITEKRFLKTISFNINLGKLKVQDFVNEVNIPF